MDVCLDLACSTESSLDKQQQAWQVLAYIAHGLALRGSPALFLLPVFQRLDECATAMQSCMADRHSDKAAAAQPTSTGKATADDRHGPNHSHSQQAAASPASGMTHGIEGVLSAALVHPATHGLSPLSTACQARVRILLMTSVTCCWYPIVGWTCPAVALFCPSHVLASVSLHLQLTSRATDAYCMQVRILWQQSCFVQSLELLLPRLQATVSLLQGQQLLLHAFAGLVASAPAQVVR